MVEGTNARQRPRLAFTKDDIDRLVATNRDFMWNDELHGARFQRIDGGQADPRWKDSPGLLWSALARYDSTLRAIFIANHNPASWGWHGHNSLGTLTDRVRRKLTGDPVVTTELNHASESDGV